jgi:hypothetical protein
MGKMEDVGTLENDMRLLKDFVTTAQKEIMFSKISGRN